MRDGDGIQLTPVASHTQLPGRKLHGARQRLPSRQGREATQPVGVKFYLQPAYGKNIKCR